MIMLNAFNWKRVMPVCVCVVCACVTDVVVYVSVYMYAHVQPPVCVWFV